MSPSIPLESLAGLDPGAPSRLVGDAHGYFVGVAVARGDGDGVVVVGVTPVIC